jgi:hypothetical protein
MIYRAPTIAKLFTLNSQIILNKNK